MYIYIYHCFRPSKHAFLGWARSRLRIFYADIASYVLMFLFVHMPTRAQPSLNLVQLSQQLYIERSWSSSYANGFRMVSLLRSCEENAQLCCSCLHHRVGHYGIDRRCQVIDAMTADGGRAREYDHLLRAGLPHPGAEEAGEKHGVKTRYSRCLGFCCLALVEVKGQGQ